MDKILNFQVSLFGSFINIKPEIALTTSLEEALRDDFIPGTAVVNNFDATTKTLTTENRMQMISKDGSWIIVFFAERIDINYMHQSEQSEITDIDSAFERALEICKRTYSVFADTKGIRIAINGKFLLEKMTDDERKKFLYAYVRFPKIYGDSQVTECNIHFNAPQELAFGAKESLCNRIIEINDIFEFVNGDSPIPRIAIGVDINTDQNNKELIYSYNDIISFADTIKPIMKSIINEVEGGMK